MSEESLRHLKESAEKIISTWPGWKKNLVKKSERNNMLVPLDGFVIIEQDEAKKESSGGIIIPDTHQKKGATGKIVAVPEYGYTEVKVGDRVLFAPFAGKNIELEDKTYLVVNYCDIEAVLA
jgi:chaperonin GroES